MTSAVQDGRINRGIDYRLKCDTRGSQSTYPIPRHFGVSEATQNRLSK